MNPRVAALSTDNAEATKKMNLISKLALPRLKRTSHAYGDAGVTPPSPPFPYFRPLEQ